MTLDTINETRTFFLLLPYILLYFYYKKFVKDDFFIKARSNIQLLFMIYSALIVFLELFAWAVLFQGSKFLGFEGFKDSGESLGIILGAGAAIIGWLFTTRAQAVNSTKANTMNILMNSRFSEEYVKNLNITTKLYMEIRQQSGERCCLSIEKFSSLPPEITNSINYMLNYFEFIAVGIRCGDLDEQFMKSSLKTIITTNYDFYKCIIQEKQKKVPSALENLCALVKRWNP